MDIRPIVTKAFEKTVKLAECNSDLKRALLESAKIRSVEQNVYNELVKANAVFMNKHKRSAKYVTLRDTAEELFQLFIHGVIQQIKEREQSDLARIAEQQKRQNQLDLEATANGKPQGAYEELVDMGLQIGETTETIEQ